MKERLFLFLVVFFIGTSVALSQTRITGTVLDESNNPVIGASIQIKGTGQGTITDIDGSFALTAPSNATLIFSYVGMHTQELPVSSRMNVILVSDSELLEEVVVIGYGTLRKENLTGAVSSVDVEKTLEGRPITDVGRALQGSTPGLVITTTSGALGGTPNIRIRGTVSTIGGGSGNPLILVDNVEVPDLSYVNPDDIESISVLKDAATTSIYGARAAFGAVLITTKKGAKGMPPTISYSSNLSWSKPSDVPQHTRADLNLQYSLDQINALRAVPIVETGQVGYYYNPDVIAKVANWIETYGDGKDLGREMVEGRDFDYRPGGGVYYYRP